MSGIGFQKLNGNGTTAHEQLVKLGELIAEIQSLNYPEIYKMARMFAPNVELVPICKHWSIPAGSEKNVYLSLDGRYFGDFAISHFQGANDNDSIIQSIFRVRDTNNIQFESWLSLRDENSSQSITAWESANKNYRGYGEDFHLENIGNGTAFHGVNVSFIGFKLSERVTEIPDTRPDNFDLLNVHDGDLDTMYSFNYTVQGVNVPIRLTFENMTKVIVNGYYVDSGVLVNNGDQIIFQIRSSLNYSSGVSASFTLGAIGPGLLIVRTKDEPVVSTLNFSTFPINSNYEVWVTSNAMEPATSLITNYPVEVGGKQEVSLPFSHSERFYFWVRVPFHEPYPFVQSDTSEVIDVYVMDMGIKDGNDAYKWGQVYYDNELSETYSFFENVNLFNSLNIRILH